MERRKVTIVIIGLVLISIATIVAGKRLGGDKTVIAVDAIEVMPAFQRYCVRSGVIEPADTVEARPGLQERCQNSLLRRETL